MFPNQLQINQKYQNILNDVTALMPVFLSNLWTRLEVMNIHCVQPSVS